MAGLEKGPSFPFWTLVTLSNGARMEKRVCLFGVHLFQFPLGPTPNRCQPLRPLACCLSQSKSLSLSLSFSSASHTSSRRSTARQTHKCDGRTLVTSLQVVKGLPTLATRSVCLSVWLVLRCVHVCLSVCVSFLCHDCFASSISILSALSP